MASFNNRAFGSNIHPKVRNKLRARQAFAESSNGNTFGSIQVKDTDGAGNEFINGALDMASELGERNFKGSNTSDSLFELGSRTPWARMWTGVQYYYFQKGGDVVSSEQEKTILQGERNLSEKWLKDGGYSKAEYGDDKTTLIGRTKEEVENELTVPLKSAIYQIGNNQYNLFSSNNPNNSIFETKSATGELLADTVSGINISDDNFYKELSNNDFMKPGAGITSINSITDGPMGAIKRTTVNFVVHNFYDYENIYMKYFLKPGALLVIDFGWDTSQIYNPEGMIKHEGKFIDELFKDGGVIEKSKGDLEVVVGYVTNFDSKVNEEGGFECSVEITSASEGLLDKKVSDKNGFKNKFVHGIVPFIVNKAAHLSGDQFLRKNWASDNETLEGSNKYAEQFADIAFGSSGLDVNINENASKYGVYYQTNSTEGGGNLYVSWGFFETEMLNGELKLGYGSDVNFGAEFNSNSTFVEYDDNLIHRQKISSLYSSDKNSFKFLYPNNWDVTYNTHRDNFPFSRKSELKNYNAELNPVGDYQYESGTGESNSKTMTEYDMSLKQIPLYELFIKVDVIKEAFNTTNSVNDAIKQILDELNEYSHQLFNLKLTTLTRDNSSLSIINEHHTGIRDTGDVYDDIFTFKPYSKGSTVKSISLNYSTPQNDIQNMISIQGSLVNTPLAVDMSDDIYQSLRMINNIDAGAGSSIGIRNIPRLDDDKSTKETSLTRTKYAFDKPDTRLLYGDEESNRMVENYKSIFSQVPVSTKELLDEGYLGLEDYDIDVGEEDGEEVDQEDINENDVNPSIVYADNLEDYFGMKAMNTIINEKNFSPIVPITLNISTYGISLIYPGDIFTIDYLPKNYRYLVYFQTMKVSHEVNSDGWTTSLESQMKIKPKDRNKSLYKIPEHVYLSSAWIGNKVSPISKKLFKNFEVTDKGTNRVMVFNATSTKSTMFKPNMEGNFTKADKNATVGFLGAYFIEDSSFSNRHDKKFEGASFTGRELYDKSTVQLKIDTSYYLVSFAGGVFVFDNWKDDYIKSIDVIIQKSAGKIRGDSYKNIQSLVKVDSGDCDICRSEYRKYPQIANLSKTEQKKLCIETIGQNIYCDWDDTLGATNTCFPNPNSCP
jgi:hypothetical protein